MRHLPCLLCDQTFLNADAVIKHCGRDHLATLDTSEAVYGADCPACGHSYARLAQHASVAHGQQVALLFADARRAGDVHGVVAARVKHLLDQILSDVERAFAAMTSRSAS